MSMLHHPSGCRHHPSATLLLDQLIVRLILFATRWLPYERGHGPFWAGRCLWRDLIVLRWGSLRESLVIRRVRRRHCWH